MRYFEIRQALFDSGSGQQHILPLCGVLKWTETLSVSASYVCPGGGTAGPLHCTTFSHFVIENKYTWCALAAVTALPRKRCDPTQRYKNELLVLSCLIWIYTSADVAVYCESLQRREGFPQACCQPPGR